MLCLCMCIQALYSFYGHFLVNMFFGCNPLCYASKGRLIGILSKSTGKSTARSSFILFFRDLLGLLFSEPMLRPTPSPRTFRGALRMPCIDFRSQGALQSQALSKWIEPYEEPLQRSHASSAGLLTGLGTLLLPLQRGHRCGRASPKNQRRQQLHAFTLLHLIYSPAFVFPLSPSRISLGPVCAEL